MLARWGRKCRPQSVSQSGTLNESKIDKRCFCSSVGTFFLFRLSSRHENVKLNQLMTNDERNRTTVHRAIDFYFILCIYPLLQLQPRCCPCCPPSHIAARSFCVAISSVPFASNYVFFSFFIFNRASIEYRVHLIMLCLVFSRSFILSRGGDDSDGARAILLSTFDVARTSESDAQWNLIHPKAPNWK